VSEATRLCPVCGSPTRSGSRCRHDDSQAHREYWRANDGSSDQWLPPLSDKLVAGPFIIREVPEPGKSQIVYDKEGQAQAWLIVQPPPPRNRLEAIWRNLRWRVRLLWRHGIWDA
jgi:hypothetical protein